MSMSGRETQWQLKWLSALEISANYIRTTRETASTPSPGLHSLVRAQQTEGGGGVGRPAGSVPAFGKSAGKSGMELELHEVVRRYEGLRVFEPTRQSRLVASLAEHGQLSAVLVVQHDGQVVLVDGYRRLAALRALGRDHVQAAELPLTEPEALILCHRLGRGDGRSALEEAWLLRELMEAHGKGVRELAVELERSASWVSRRLGLLSALPESAQRAVREGRLVAHGAQRYLVPLARANEEHCELLLDALGKDRLSVRQLARIYLAWSEAEGPERREIVTRPQLFLKADEAIEDSEPAPTPEAILVQALEQLSSVGQRALRELRRCRERPLPTSVRLAWQQAHAGVARLNEELGGA